MLHSLGPSHALSIYQVPAELIGPFVEWVRNSSIRVVHLVREASLLRHLSSDEAHRTNNYHTLPSSYQTAHTLATRRLSGSGAPVRIELERMPQVCAFSNPPRANPAPYSPNPCPNPNPNR